MKPLAIIYATFRQSMHRKLFWVWLAISGISTLICLSIGFDDIEGVSLFFGGMSIPWDSLEGGMDTPEGFVKSFLTLWLSMLAGTLGIALALVSTAGFVPEFLEEGAIHVVLAKPMSRWTIFLAKVAGGVTFIAFHTFVFVGGAVLAVGIRSGIWLPSYFAAAVLLIFVFIYLYPVSVWLGMRSRSAMVAVLGTFVFWFACGSVQGVKSAFDMHRAAVNVGDVERSPFVVIFRDEKGLERASHMLEWFGRGVTILDAVVPKTGDLGLMTQDLLGWEKQADELVGVLGNVSAERERARREFEKVEEFTYLESLGTSFGFVAVVLFLAGRSFVKRDF